MAVKTKKRYFSLKPFLDKGKFFNMIATERGFGKTYAVKRYVMFEFLKKGAKFIYLRRRKPELKRIRQFWDDLAQNYPEYKFEVKGWDFFIDGQHCGQALLLNRFQDYKSSPFPDYETIIFDEFIREKVEGVGYLPNEVECMMNLCDSILRDRKNNKVFLLANSISIVNPYYIEFQININLNSKYQQSYIQEMNKYVVCYIQRKDSETIEKERNDDTKSDFRKMVDLMNYGRMANNNEFVADDKTFIENRSKNSLFKFQIILNGKYYGVWNDKRTQLLFISERTDRTTKRSFCFDPKDKKEKDILIRKFTDSYQTLMLSNKFKKDQLRFESQNVKSEMINNFARLGIY